MRNKRVPKSYVIDKNFEIEPYEAVGGPAVYIRDLTAFHEHKQLSVLLDDLELILQWYKKTYPERQK